MAKTFQVEVVTPDRTALATEASSLQVPAWGGYLGVLANHAPLLTVLRAGVVTIKDDNERPSFFAIRGGFMEVAQNRAIILADDFVDAAKLQRSEVDKAIADALQPIGEVGGDTAEERQRLRKDAEEQREAAALWARARYKALEGLEDARG